VHDSTILGLPSRSQCSMTTITRRAPVDEIHGAAHAFDHLPGHHPVRQIAGGGDLHAAEHSGVNMAAADHAERQGGVEECGTGDDGDGFLAGVDQVRINVVVGGDMGRCPGSRFPNAR